MAASHSLGPATRRRGVWTGPFTPRARVGRLGGNPVWDPLAISTRAPRCGTGQIRAKAKSGLSRLARTSGASIPEPDPLEGAPDRPMSRIVVPFYFGLGSRYSYLAATQLDRIEAANECCFEWLPLQSGQLIRRANGGRSPFEGDPRSGQYDWAYRQRDAEAWARYYGIRYKEPVAFRIDPADLAKACWAADADGNSRR